MEGNIPILRIPYTGSKQAIVKELYNIINNDLGNYNCLFSQDNKITTIYDLFCGGGSVGYYFYNNGYKVYMNDIQSSIIGLHKVLNTENSPLTRDLLYKWISREEFHEFSKLDNWYGALIRACWSFGNSGRTYLYGKDIEDYKRCGHYVVINKCVDSGKKLLELIDKQDEWSSFEEIYNIKSQNKRRLFLRRYTRYLSEQLQALQHLEHLQQSQHLEHLQRLKHLQHLQNLQHLQKNVNFSCKNYWDFDFEPNSIIYCDPPYINTTDVYRVPFDFNEFDTWVDKMVDKGIRVYISEYTNHNNKWREVGSIDKQSLMDSARGQRVVKQEKIFCNI